jgi:hypothetical protein
MSLSFGGNKSKSSNSTSYTPNPLTTSLYQPLFSSAEGQIETPFKPYSGELYPGLSAGQQQAQGLAQQNLGAGSQAVGSGIAAAQGLSGFRAPQLTAPRIAGAQASTAVPITAAQIAPGSVPVVTPGSLAATDLSPYLNPYTQQVVDATNRDIDQQRAQAINNQAGQFTQAGAFGGSREGVADALTNKAYGQIAAQTDAGLNAQGFTGAQQAAESDLGQKLQAQLANQGAAQQAAGLNAQLAQGAGQFNASEADALAQLNAELGEQSGLAQAGYDFGAQQGNLGGALSAAQLGLSDAGLLGSLGQTQQGLGLNDINAIDQLGTQAQQTSAAQDQAAYQQYLLGLQYPFMQAQASQGLLGTIPTLQTLASSKGTGSQSSNGFGLLFSGGKSS